ncbi:ribosome-binding factor A [Spiroplasma clarkii]|uniref:Ribosome-binding factor A n=1 Tax=Spiroplasma clarkii TaxID=2139 RepID=A0A1Y0L1S8_9MOLU|nr:30S ribosome-binding factor RbfA [Spiroplasma clarkii]ARU91933.1 ribosome-binding factor A [Spiroplasma clarkii]ATX71275.1 ribosome-binding factor A [Spiroplasma clarkii]
MPNEIKIERAQSTILRELNLILQREFPDSEYLNGLTIREVRLTNDMSQAKVFYSLLYTDADLKDVEAEVKEYLKEIRMLLASKIEMKSVPELIFEYDKSLDNANKIEQILKEIKE